MYFLLIIIFGFVILIFLISSLCSNLWSSFNLFRFIKGILISIVVFGSSFTLLGQIKGNAVVIGKLFDSLNGEWIEKATVFVTSLHDSSLTNSSLTNAKGDFQIRNLNIGSYNLYITYQGYQPINKKFILSATTPQLNFGIFNMEKKINILDEVVVKAAPIEIKKDTIEFRASAFKTAPNSTAESLLKKLPGVVVDRDGNVKAQGEEVEKIYVDGKEFFGTDPKIATKNITADMVESVQVYNDKSDQTKLASIDDRTHIKVINIKLKKNTQKGFFGKALAAYGTSNQYQTTLNYNNFRETRRISVLGGYNNLAFDANNIDNSIKNPSSNYRQILAMPGIGSAIFTGVNYSNRLRDKLNFTGSYFYSAVDNHNKNIGSMKSFFPGDSSTIRNNQSEYINKTERHNFNQRMEYLLDSNTSVLFTSNANLQKYSNNNTDSYSILSEKLSSVVLYNSGKTRNIIEPTGMNVNNTLLYRKKFKKARRTFAFGYNNITNIGMDNNRNESLIIFYRHDESIRRLQNQDITNHSSTHRNKNVINFSFAEPVGKNKLLEFNYSYAINYAAFKTNALNYDSLTGKYDSVNPQVKNFFTNNFKAHRYGITFQVQLEKCIFQAGGVLQVSQVVNKTNRVILNLGDKDSTVAFKQRFINFFPAIHITYQFTPFKHLQVNYDGRTQQPGITQLQQFADITNPLKVRVGNFFLRQEFNNNFNIGYSSFNTLRFRYFNFNFNLSQTSNKIINSIDTIPLGTINNIYDKSAQLIKPINVDGVFSSYSYIAIGMPLRILNGSNYTFTNFIYFNRSITEIYKLKNITNQVVISQTANIDFDLKDKLNVVLEANVSYYRVKYSVHKSLNTQYILQTYMADLNYSLSKSLLINTSFAYSSNSGFGSNNNSFLLWNISFAVQILKKKTGEIKLSGNDILKQNSSFIRTVSENYISDVKSQVNPRCFIVSFTYNFNSRKLEGKKIHL